MQQNQVGDSLPRGVSASSDLTGLIDKQYAGAITSDQLTSNRLADDALYEWINQKGLTTIEEDLSGKNYKADYYNNVSPGEKVQRWKNRIWKEATKSNRNINGQQGMWTRQLTDADVENTLKEWERHEEMEKDSFVLSSLDRKNPHDYELMQKAYPNLIERMNAQILKKHAIAALGDFFDQNSHMQDPKLARLKFELMKIKTDTNKNLLRSYIGQFNGHGAASKFMARYDPSMEKYYEDTIAGSGHEPHSIQDNIKIGGAYKGPNSIETAFKSLFPKNPKYALANVGNPDLVDVNDIDEGPSVVPSRAASPASSQHEWAPAFGLMMG